MNEPENYDPESQTPTCCADVDSMVRENPTRSILLAVGVGVVLALIVRALQPRPVENRAARLLEDLRERLGDFADPAYQRASGLASNGAALARNGADHLSNLHLDRTLHRVAGKVRKFFR